TVLYSAIPTNTNYYFRVKAVSRTGLETAYTTEIATPTLADAPTDAATTDTGISSASFAWNRATNPPLRTKYVAQVAQDSGFTNALQSSSTFNETASFTGLTSDTSYSFRVRAENSAG